jgi:hypothetical protein
VRGLDLFVCLLLGVTKHRMLARTLAHEQLSMALPLIVCQ